MSDQGEKIEKYLIQALLDGTYAPGGTLPGERELAELLGVSRQNVQGVIGRMAREGWFTTGERCVTRVNDFWSRGTLAVLNSLANNIDDNHLAGFVGDVLAVRRVIAPAYTMQAVGGYPMEVVRYLDRDWEDRGGLARFDFGLHLTLARLSGSRIYPMLLNSFAALALQAGVLYYNYPACVEASRGYFSRLKAAAVKGDAKAAYRYAAAAMKESCHLWQKISGKDAG